MSKKIRVLVVDDSLVFRQFLSKGIAKDPMIEVIGTAVDPFTARDKIVDLEPDVMTLDVEMPRMNGIEFLEKLMAQYPMPVIVVSSRADSALKAMRAGASDFIEKPSDSHPENMDAFLRHLIVKIKMADIVKNKKGRVPEKSADISRKTLRETIIAIGASTGGTEALSSLMSALPREMPGIVIVQHMPPVFTKMFADRLNNSCRMEVKEAENGDKVVPGRALIAPGDYHMQLKKDKSHNNYYVKCLQGEKVNGHCPSVEVLFNSVAETAGKFAVGVILTGMGNDGAKGLLKMKESGAYTIGQDEKSCVVYGMPKVAWDIGAVQEQAALSDIPNVIQNYLVGKEDK